MTDQWLVKSEKQLDEILGKPAPGVGTFHSDRFDALARDFIGHSPLVLVSTVDAEGRLDVSPKGDAPGFCHIADERTLLIPDRKGNRLAFGFRNILQTGRIGLIFLLPKSRETLRVNGSAEITHDPAILQRLEAKGKPALLCTKVHVEECFLHCGKAMIRSKLWQPDEWIDIPDVGFGRRSRERMIDNGSAVEDANERAIITNELAEKAYREDLY